MVVLRCQLVGGAECAMPGRGNGTIFDQSNQGGGVHSWLSNIACELPQ